MAREGRNREKVRAERQEEAFELTRVQRHLAERLVAHAELLPAPDRVLVQTVFGDGRSPPDLARLMGQTDRVVRRRVARLVRRVNSPRFLFVSRHMQHWQPTRRHVAQAVVLGGLSYRRAAEALRLSTYAVRLHIHAVNAMFEVAMRAA